MNDREVVEGVARGVFAFLNDRPVSVVDPAIKQISEAVGMAITDWLDCHEDEIIEAISKQSKGNS